MINESPDYIDSKNLTYGVNPTKTFIIWKNFILYTESRPWTHTQIYEAVLDCVQILKKNNKTIDYPILTKLIRDKYQIKIKASNSAFISYLRIIKEIHNSIKLRTIEDFVFRPYISGRAWTSEKILSFWDYDKAINNLDIVSKFITELKWKEEETYLNFDDEVILFNKWIEGNVEDPSDNVSFTIYK